MWGYLRELRRMRLAAVRLFQRGSEREIAEAVARCGRDLERLKQAARFEEALFRARRRRPATRATHKSTQAAREALDWEVRPE